MPIPLIVVPSSQPVGKSLSMLPLSSGLSLAMFRNESERTGSQPKGTRSSKIEFLDIRFSECYIFSEKGKNNSLII